MTIKKFPIEAGQILLFARAIGDDNPIYWDEEYAENTGLGSIIAPPTFVISDAHYDSEFPLRPRTGEPWIGSGENPTGIKKNDDRINWINSGLHGKQHFEYMRNLKPGDVLYTKTKEGETWLAK